MTAPQWIIVVAIVIFLLHIFVGKKVMGGIDGGEIVSTTSSYDGYQDNLSRPLDRINMNRY